MTTGREFTIVGNSGLRCSLNCWEAKLRFTVGFENGRHVLDMDHGGYKLVCKCVGAPDRRGHFVTPHSRVRDLRDCLMEQR